MKKIFIVKLKAKFQTLKGGIIIKSSGPLANDPRMTPGWPRMIPGLDFSYFWVIPGGKIVFPNNE